MNFRAMLLPCLLGLGACANFAPTKQHDGDSDLVGVCIPKPCDAGSCGAFNDGCGAVLDCGGCDAPATCGGGGVQNRCGVAVQVADAAVTVTNNATESAAGATTTYTIVVTNQGPASLDDAALAVSFDSDLTGVAWSCVVTGVGTVSAASGSGAVAITVDLAPSASITCTATASIAASPSGAIEVTATIGTGSASDPDASDNSATDTDSIAAPTQADASISVSNGVTAIAPGAGTTYTVVVGNVGPAVLQGAQAAITFSAGLTNVSWSCAASTNASCGATGGSGNISTTVTVAPASTVTFTATATASTSAAGPHVVNATIGTGALNDSNSGNNSAQDSDAVIAPDITAIGFTPSQVGRSFRQGKGAVTMNVTGTTFTGVSSVTLGAFAVSGFVVNSPTSLTVSATIPHGAALGTADLVITGPGGSDTELAAVSVEPITSGPGGSDASGLGTDVSHYRTVTKALAMSAAGDTVRLQDGDYRGSDGESFPCCPTSGACVGAANVPGGVTLIVDPGSQAILSPTGSAACPSSGQRVAFTINDTTATIDGAFQLNNFLVGVHVRGATLTGQVTLRGVQINGATKNGVRIEGPIHVRMEPTDVGRISSVSGSTESGVYFTSSDFGVIPILTLANGVLLSGNTNGLETAGATRAVLTGDVELLANTNAGVLANGTSPFAGFDLDVDGGSALVGFYGNYLYGIVANGETRIRRAEFKNQFSSNDTDVFLQRGGTDGLQVGDAGSDDVVFDLRPNAGASETLGLVDARSITATATTLRAVAFIRSGGTTRHAAGNYAVDASPFWDFDPIGAGNTAGNSVQVLAP